MAPAGAPLFIDSSAWIALAHRRDQAHGAAAHIWPAIRAGRRELVTTDLVVAEAHRVLVWRIGSKAAALFLDQLLDRGDQRIIWTDAPLARNASARWLRRFQDKTFSLADAVSFEVMRREGIREAFAFDQDFRRAGFHILR